MRGAAVTNDDERPAGSEGIFQGLPKGVRWIPVVLFVGAVVLYEGVVPDFMGGDHWSLGRGGVAAAVVVIVAVALAAPFALTRGRLGGAHQVRLFRVALREGRVPEDADREKWASEVSRRLHARGGLRERARGPAARGRHEERLRVLAEQL